jgi:hypothetical protein
MRKTKKGGSLFKKMKNTTRKLFKKEKQEKQEKRDFTFYMCGDDTDDPEEFLNYLVKTPKQKYKLNTIKLENKQESKLNISELENKHFTSNNGGRMEYKKGDIEKILQNIVPSFETIHIATSFDPIHAAQAIIFLLLTLKQNIDIIYIHLSPFLGVKKNIKYSDYWKNLNKNLVNYLIKSQEVKIFENVDIHICIQKEEILKLNINGPHVSLPYNSIKNENELFAKTVRITENNALKFIKETNNINEVFTSQDSMNQILDKFNTYVDERTRNKMMKKIFKFFIKFKIQNCLFSKLDVTYDSNNILMKQDTQQNGFDRVFCMTNKLNPNIAKIMYQNLHYAFFNIPRTVSSDQKPYIQYINVDDVYTGDIVTGDGVKRSKLYLLPDPNSNYFKKYIKLFFKDQTSNHDMNQIANEIIKKDKIYYKNMKKRIELEILKKKKELEILKEILKKKKELEILKEKKELGIFDKKNTLNKEILKKKKELEILKEKRELGIFDKKNTLNKDISNKDISNKERELITLDNFYKNNTLNKDMLKEVIKMYVENYNHLRDQMLSGNEKQNLKSYITNMNEGDKKEINEIYYAIRKRTESSDYYRYAIPLLFLLYGKSLL